MANFNPNIDLLAIPGAKPATFDEGGKKVNYICIPADLNEIRIEPSRNDQSRFTAYMRLRMSALRSSYIDKIVQDKQRRGDVVDMTRIESHEVTLNHTKEYIDAWTDRVAKKLIGEHPEWANQNPREAVRGADDLYYEIRRTINKRIGKAYPVIASDQRQAQQQPMQFNTFGQMEGYTPEPAPAAAAQQAPQASAAPAMGGEAKSDDLPF